jgi:hypothetical protein
LTETITPPAELDAPVADVLAAGGVVAVGAEAEVVPAVELLLPQPAARATAAATQPSMNGFLTNDLLGLVLRASQ